jgi:hypothetical protein
MGRITGTYRTRDVGGEKVKAFVPHPLPPCDPPLLLGGGLTDSIAKQWRQPNG